MLKTISGARLIVVSSILLSVTVCRGQSRPADEVQAHDAAMRFLQGIKLAALPEGKKMLADTQWILGAADYGQNFYSRPDYTEFTSLYAGLFDTDVSGIKGYKELFDMKAVTKAGTAKNLKFLVIAFKDADSQKWKIVSSLDNAGGESGIDVEQEVAFWKDKLSDPATVRLVSLRGVYFPIAHWLLLDGRIKEARAALESAKTASTEGVASKFPEEISRLNLQIDALLDVIAKATAGSLSK